MSGGLIDPNAADLRGVPKSAEDLFISGGVNHLVSLENVSHLPAPLQDAMCTVATGGGFAKRKLYTDGDESVISLKRPIVLNGIAASVTQQDLVSRTLTIEMPVIRSAQAKAELEVEFEASRASILGGLLDITARALESLPMMWLPAERRPRLVEFAYLGMAIAKGLGDAMRRAAPALRQLGIECRCLGKIGSTVKWRIGKKPQVEQSRQCLEVVVDVPDKHDFKTSTTSAPLNSFVGVGHHLL